MANFIFSLFEGGIRQTVPSSTCSLTQLFYRIVNDETLKNAVDVLRKLPFDSEAQRTAKGLLPYVLPSGTFTRRAKGGLENYSGIICVDVDHVPVENIETLKRDVIHDEKLNPLLIFVSPRGEGLKIFLPTDGDQSNHRKWFEHYAEHFQLFHHVEIDKACKDISRACFLSYDPCAYIGELKGVPSLPNEPSEYFQYVETEEKKNGDTERAGCCEPLVENVGSDTLENMTQKPLVPSSYASLSDEEKKINARRLLYRLWDVRRWNLHVCDYYSSYFEFVSACASSTGEYGRETCREICKHSLKYDEEAFDKLYSAQIDNKENTYTYGTVVFYVDAAKNTEKLNNKAVFDEDWTWEDRPKWIPKGETRNMEICYIMGFLTSASSIMPHVYFYHDNQRYYLNLYTIVQGELASGKSKVTQMTKCVDQIDAFMRINSDQKLPFCLKETGNITDAMLIFDLAYNQSNINNGSMLIHVAEIDVMSQKKKIGLSSENTRLAWGHETISAKRKGMDTQSRQEDRKGYIIEEPRVSILMTGTPSQLPNYFTNNTDGNLSRYLIYTLDECKDYRSGLYPPTRETEADYSDLFEMWKKQRETNVHTRLEYTEAQKQQLDEIFTDLKSFYAKQNDKFHNYINRLPIAVRRLAGVIETLTVWSTGNTTEATLTPTDEHWTFAIQLVLNSLQSLYKLYSHPAISHQEEEKRQVWIDILKHVPTKFSTNDFLNVALTEGFSQRSTARGLLFLRLNNYIKQTRRGWYEKIEDESCI